MIIKLKQLSSWDRDHYLPLMNFQYEYVVKDQVEYTASITRNFQEMNGDIRKNNESTIVLNYKFTEELKPESLSIYNIKDTEGNDIGKIQEQKVGGLFGGYKYIEMTIKDKVYNIYNIGKGKEGKYTCIYVGDKQIGMIENPIKVTDGKDEYTIYLDDDKEAIPVCLYSLYNDYVNYNSPTDTGRISIRTEYSLTTNKTLKSKYDPNFKEMVLNKEKPEELGEYIDEL